MRIDESYQRHRINEILNGASREELEAVTRILDNPKYRLVRIGGETAVIEIPLGIVADVMRMIKAAYPDLGLSWTDGKTALQRDVETRLERMRK